MTFEQWLLKWEETFGFILIAIAVVLYALLLIAIIYQGDSMNDTQEIEAFGWDYFNCSHNGAQCENITNFRLKANAECAYYNRIQTNNTSCWT
jgi:hypothetical protein